MLIGSLGNQSLNFVKRAKYDPEVDESKEHKGDRPRRAETPEEGEI